jgi:hypothetical protein
MLQLTDVTVCYIQLGVLDFLFFCRGRWVAALFSGSFLGSNPDISKIANGRQKQISGKHQKNTRISVWRRLDFSIVDLCIMSSVTRLITLWCSTVRDETTVAVSDLQY